MFVAMISILYFLTIFEKSFNALFIISVLLSICKSYSILVVSSTNDNLCVLIQLFEVETHIYYYLI